MERCFVIQPFDGDVYDRRYDDVFKPAITKSDLEPYRIDKDLSVRIPIEEIEKGILESAICFAEITTDNPNVWYELGFAFACKKDVVMVCSDERKDKFPFDIQHRQIVKYKTSSKSDFETLEKEITNKIKAYQQTSKTIIKLNASPVIETEGLKSHEIAVLILLMQYQLTNVPDEDAASTYTLKQEMDKAGYNDIATSLAVRTLEMKGMLKKLTLHDENAFGHPDPACVITDVGVNWILQNQNQLEFRKKPSKGIVSSPVDDLPF